MRCCLHFSTLKDTPVATEPRKTLEVTRYILKVSLNVSYETLKGLVECTTPNRSMKYFTPFIQVIDIVSPPFVKNDPLRDHSYYLSATGM